RSDSSVPSPRAREPNNRKDTRLSVSKDSSAALKRSSACCSAVVRALCSCIGLSYEVWHTAFLTSSLHSSTIVQNSLKVKKLRAVQTPIPFAMPGSMMIRSLQPVVSIVAAPLFTEGDCPSDRLLLLPRYDS